MSDVEHQVEEGGHVVRIRKDQFETLEAVYRGYHEDVLELATRLGIVVNYETKSPRRWLYEDLLPRVDGLMVTQGFVDSSTAEIKAAAARFDNKTIRTARGATGLKVGERLSDATMEAIRKDAKRRGHGPR